MVLFLTNIDNMMSTVHYPEFSHTLHSLICHESSSIKVSILPAYKNADDDDDDDDDDNYKDGNDDRDDDDYGDMRQ